MDIGNKIQKARKETNLTQEKVAEGLGVSRQTISNWENNKSYPDILSVIKMSDLYSVSLDYLLKGEQPMSNYLEYLEESTSIVKSKNRISKIILLVSYLVIWAIAMLEFWIFLDGSDAMGYALVYLWIILPVTTMVISCLIAKNNYWKNRRWLIAVCFGIMYMLAGYATFTMANMVSTKVFRMPDFALIIYGAIFSGIGFGIGTLFKKRKQKRKG